MSARLARSVNGQQRRRYRPQPMPLLAVLATLPESGVWAKVLAVVLLTLVVPVLSDMSHLIGTVLAMRSLSPGPPPPRPPLTSSWCLTSWNEGIISTVIDMYQDGGISCRISVLRTETISRPYSGPAFFRVEETITRHDDQTYIRHVVRHPGGVAVVAMLGKQAICVEQYRPAIRQVVLEVPAGRPRAGEAPVDTGRRELIEETGYTPVSMIFLARFYNAPCFCDGATEVFLADVASAQ